MASSCEWRQRYVQSAVNYKVFKQCVGLPPDKTEDSTMLGLILSLVRIYSEYFQVLRREINI